MMSHEYYSFWNHWQLNFLFNMFRLTIMNFQAQYMAVDNERLGWRLLKQFPPFHYYTPRTTKLLGGILVSLCPSVRPSVPHPVSALWCLQFWLDLFDVNNLIKQLQKVCRVQSFLQNFKIWILGNFFKFVIFTLCCLDLGSDVNH